MRVRSNWRTVGGGLVLVVLMVSPTAAAAAPDVERVGWIETLESWWGGLAQLMTGAGKNDGGPSIDPGGASAIGEQETDDGPTIDPGG